MKREPNTIMVPVRQDAMERLISQAKQRGFTAVELAAEIVRTVAMDDLINAVLGEVSGERERRAADRKAKR